MYWQRARKDDSMALTRITASGMGKQAILGWARIFAILAVPTNEHPPGTRNG